MLKFVAAGLLTLLVATLGTHQVTPPTLQSAYTRSAQTAATAPATPQTATSTAPQSQDLSSQLNRESAPSGPPPSSSGNATASADKSRSAQHTSTPGISSPSYSNSLNALQSNVAALTNIVQGIVSIIPALRQQSPTLDAGLQQQLASLQTQISQTNRITQLPQNVIVSGGMSGLKASDIPSISLTSGVNGVLPVSGGGTGWANINAGSLLFGNGSSALATSSNLVWDNTNSRVGIGTLSPGTALDVAGTAKATMFSGNGSGLYSTPPSIFTTYTAFGDSITAGALASPNSNGYPYLIAADTNTVLTNDGITSAMAADIANSEVFSTIDPTASYNPLYTVMVGTNDADVKGMGAYEAIYKLSHQAILSWLAISQPFKIFGQSATVSTSTGWVVDNTYQTGIGIKSTTTGSTAVFPITTGGGPIYIWYRFMDGNGGVFTYNLDGGSPTSVNAYSSPSISTSLGVTQSAGIIRILNVAAGAHTVNITVTSSTGAGNVVSILGVGTVPFYNYYGAPEVFSAGVPLQQVANGNNAALAAYNADALADVNLLAGDGLKIYFVNVQNYLNNTTDLVNSHSDGIHPNNAGHQHLRDAFESVMQFIPNSGVSSNGFSINGGFQPSTSTQAALFSMNAPDIISSSNSTPGVSGIVFTDTAGGTFNGGIFSSGYGTNLAGGLVNGMTFISPRDLDNGYGGAANWGFRFNSASGVTRMFIDGLTGYLGIDTSTPKNFLTVAGYNGSNPGATATFSSELQGANTGGFQVNITNSALSWGMVAGYDGPGVSSSGFHSANTGYIANVNNGSLNFGTSNTLRMAITGSGNVGFGTSTPDSNLSIYSATKPTLEFSLGASIGIWTEGIDTSNGNSFEIASSSSLGTNPRLVINGAGNIGVGTSTPNAILSIAGTFVPAASTQAAVLAEAVPTITSTPGANPGVPGILFSDSNNVGGGNGGIFSSLFGTNVANGLVDGMTFISPRDLDGGYGGTVNWGFRFNSQSGFTRMFIDTASGNVGIGTTSPDTLLTVGSVTPSGNVAHFENSTGSCYINPTTTSLSCSSDQRLKRNITPIDASSTLAGVLDLKPVSYNWLAEATGTPSHIGFIAQDVQSVFPDLVSQGPDGYYTLNYAGFAPYLTEAIKQVATLSDPFRTTLAAWLGDAGNGIANLYAGIIHSDEEHTKKFCAEKSDGSEVCLSGDQLADFLTEQGGALTNVPALSNTNTASMPATTSSITAQTVDATSTSAVPSPVATSTAS